MRDPRIQLKNPILAGVLAWLLPGAGHFYQQRYFKAGVYFVCILGLFLTGMAMAEWKAVQPPPKAGPGKTKLKMAKYGAQLAVGLPAMYGLIQRERYSSKDNQLVQQIDETIVAPFEGRTQFHDDDGVYEGDLAGEITLKPVDLEFGGQAISGQFEGTLNDEPITLQLSTNVELDRPIEADDRRSIWAGLVREKNGQQIQMGHLQGSIPRGFLDWFQVPVDDQEEQELHRRLGKKHEVAMVFTWIAGLLNILAIWDAVEGPAFGYGDEHKNEDEAAAEDAAVA
ncbi:MAG: hypothetical protein KDA80_16710 [Planctomycetaceae bacterium]|nr:hypothetical protein [Planctomycetaceae bacterium]